MAYEIDFLPVGDGERSGDAIALRFGTLANSNEQTVVVLDGGTKESGSALVEHIERYYGTDRVDAAVCTHSDADHASGLTEVIENLDVKRLCMHLPWNHAGDLENQLKKAPVGDSVRQHFRKSLESAHDLENLARKRGIPVFELFSDTSKPNSAFTVLGPSTTFYESLLASFRCADELGLKESLLAKAMAAAKATDKAVRWIGETWDKEALFDPDEDACSAENNSSLVLLFTHEDSKFLFTSDAGVLALGHAADYAERIGIDLHTVGGIQIPHHGSKRNVGPSILDRIIGPKLLNARTAAATKNAIVSASIAGEPKHPSKRVVNGFKRRGASVAATQGKPLCKHSADVAPRPGWRTADVLPFYDQVEE